MPVAVFAEVEDMFSGSWKEAEGLCLCCVHWMTVE